MSLAKAETPQAQAEIRMAAMTVAAAFRASGWTWAGSDQPPTVDKIEQAIWRLVTNLSGNPDAEEGWSSSSGRISVQIGDEGDLHISVDLCHVEHFFALGDDK